MKVHGTLGSGFQEVIYQRALAIENAEAIFTFFQGNGNDNLLRQYSNWHKKSRFLCGNIIMLELKAVIELNDVHLAQAINYLEAYRLPVGLLINFGSRSLTFKRVYNTKHPDNKHQD